MEDRISGLENKVDELKYLDNEKTRKCKQNI
jgi:hypothetical protein